MKITVLSLAEARRRHGEFHAVLTIEDVEAGDGLRIDDIRGEQLVLKFEDLDDDGPGACPAYYVGQAIVFGRRYADEDILIHCVKGQARSPAIALAIIADRLGPGREGDAVKALLTIRPDTDESLLGPNLHVLRVADAVLHRDGALISAWMDYEKANWNEKRERYRFWRQMAPTMDQDSPGP